MQPLIFFSWYILLLAIVHTSGKTPVLSERFKMKVSCSINAIKPSFNNLLETSATPEDLQMSMT